LNRRNICYILGGAMAVLGLVLLLALSDSLSTDVPGLALLVAGGIVGLMFTKTPVIAWRELMNYFVSPIAYILMAAYLVVVALIFNFGVLAGHRAHLEPLFGSMTWLALFLCPIITMRLLSEEARSGTLETVLTTPITDVEITLGKFFGAFAFYVTVNLPTLAFVYILAWQGNPDLGTIAASYLGVLLLGALLISIGLLASAFTKNQVIAAFVGFVAMFALFIVGELGRVVGGEFSIFGLEVDLGKIIEYAGSGGHYMDFTRGVVNSQHVLYFVMLCVFFLFLTVRMVESHKWR